MKMTSSMSSPFAFVGGEPLEVETFANPDALAASQSGIVAADQSANGKLLVRGEAAEQIITTTGVREISVGRGVTLEHSSVYRLRQDLYFINTLPGGTEEMASQLVQAVSERGVFVTVTDVTHGRSELMLAGSGCRALMSKLCSVDFGEHAFPDNSAVQTSFAKTKQLIIRRDKSGMSAFAVIGGRSSASYLWETTMEAGAEFGITPIGASALREWRE